MSDNTVPEQRLDTAEMAAILDSFKSDLKFPMVDPVNDMTEILTKINNRAFLKTLSPVETMEYAVLISNYSFYLTSQENRLIAFIGWAESNLKIIVGKNLRETEGYFNEKDLYIRSHEENAIKLCDMKLVAETKLNTIKWQSQKLQLLS